MGAEYHANVRGKSLISSFEGVPNVSLAEDSSDAPVGVVAKVLQDGCHVAFQLPAADRLMLVICQP